MGIDVRVVEQIGNTSNFARTDRIFLAAYPRTANPAAAAEGDSVTVAFTGLELPANYSVVIVAGLYTDGDEQNVFRFRSCPESVVGVGHAGNRDLRLPRGGLMGALTIIPRDSAPPARQALIALNARIADAEKRLRTLQNGRDALASELGRAASAKAELAELVDNDAVRLVDRLRNGAQWALSAFGSARAKELAAAMSESRIQAAVGERALEAVTEEIAVLERELAELKAAKPDRIRAVLIEAAVGFHADMAVLVDDMRQIMTVLSALDGITARSTGEWQPDKRIVVAIPPVGGVPEQVVVAPHAAIEKAKAIWARFSAELESNALANVEALSFPHVLGTEDQGKISYHELSHAERLAIDLARAQGV
jgi:hypothetical protein